MYDYPTSGCLCVKSVNQSIPDGGSGTEITWVEFSDTDGFFNAASNTLMVIPHSMAAVRLVCNVQWPVIASNDRFIFFNKNGLAFPGGAAEIVPGPGSASRSRQNIATPPVPVVSGDIFDVRAFQNTGSGRNIEADPETWFQLVKVDSLHGALVTRSTDVFSVAGSGALAYVQWADMIYDTGSFWNSSSPSMFYFWNSSVSYARFYAGIQWAASATKEFFLNIDKNGASVEGGGAVERNDLQSTSQVRNCLVSGVIRVSSGDYFEVQVRHDTAGNHNVVNNGRSYFAFEVVDDG